MKFTVYLIDENKRPVVGERINVSFMSPRGVWMEDAVTNGDGYALFINDKLESESGGVTLTVDDKLYDLHPVNDKDLLTIHV